ncbi:DUF3592 domain-containing protein [uncultured Maribacter sp.]|uniref:DUF3592 domain-containing protein n=1 Tax=uncultured Maribacter sp. TaxID=431308 RepID=UPI0026069964|nr:DUF3592 domain-containing protein [uncultured Maribacter sp.]
MNTFFKIALICLCLFFSSLNCNGQENSESWIETKAKITEIHNSISRKGTQAFVDVSYSTSNGKTFQSRVKVMAIPYIGTLKSKNDSIVILYNKETPQLTKTSEVSFLNSYGIYLLFGAGILFSIWNFTKKT